MRSLRVLIAPDKFKGTLTAAEAAGAIADGWARVRPTDRLTLAPISDGGDGFGPILGAGLGARPRILTTVDAAHRKVRSQWWWEAGNKTAVIESANVIGLAMLPKGRFHPFELDTFGLGRIVLAARRAGAGRCFVGIGGSATNDGGFGLARALGWQFFDRRGTAIGDWPGLVDLHTIVAPQIRRPIRSLTVAVDVQNKLLGKLGCSRVYGPQKGLGSDDFAVAEAALRRLARVMKDLTGNDLAGQAGAGAAGGLGFGLGAFAGARMKPGFDLIARQLKLATEVRRADLVISGEGSLDRSTAMGKGVGELALLCRRHSKRCIGLAGIVKDRRKVLSLLTAAHGLRDITSERGALREAGRWLTELASRTAAGWSEAA
jgi:glycerate 2-kinase